MTNSHPLFRLDNKITLITGASRGIGASIAKLFAQQGSTVIISSRKQSSLDELAKQLKQQDIEVTPMACHIGDPKSVNQLINQIEKRFGGIDILINNAATNPFFGELL